MTATRTLIWTAAKGIAQGAVSFMQAPQLIVSELGTQRIIKRKTPVAPYLLPGDTTTTIPNYPTSPPWCWSPQTKGKPRPSDN